MSAELAGQTAVVTGASRGIGRGIAAMLAARGAHVVVNYVSNADSAAAVVDAITAAGGSAHAAGFDVGDPTATRDALKDIVDRQGRIDIFVANAGVSIDGLVLRFSDDDWNRVLQTNLTGVFHCARAALRTMVRNRYGRIVSVTSVVAGMGNAGQTAYAAAKAGVEGFTRSLAREVASRGITVNAVAPGFVDTEMTAALDAGQRAAYTGLIPVGRMGTPDDVAAAVAFLASPAAGYVTGHVLHVNGGLWM
ncbi:MAG: 3-oxoacyl-[acyl-carrier-protein] reductase [bacterium]|nr:3-oxoacyl-[acyl-carrier-protein] reductase [bacterium]